MNSSSERLVKSPRAILPGLFAFPPNRETLGGTSYLICQENGNFLIDCPLWDEGSQDFLEQQGGVKGLILTHRGGMGKGLKALQSIFACEVIIQEQEAYLLPEITVWTFREELRLNENITVIWTAGYSPGSSCVYWSSQGGVLFTGRHLLPNQEGYPVPLRLEKTFHWPRQLKSVEKLQERFTAETLNYLCPGGNTGFLRGKGYIESGYQALMALDLTYL